MNDIKGNSREKHLQFYASNSKPTLQYTYSILPVLVKLIYLLIPASAYGCSKEMEAPASTDMNHIGTMLHISECGSPRAAEASTIDIFAFNDDPHMRLDSYMRRDSYPEDLKMVTQSGGKLLFLIANSRKDKYYWAGVTSYHSMNDTYMTLEQENKDLPTMTGQCHIEAGDQTNYKVEMKRLSSEIALRSVKCDFSGKPYEGEKIKNPKTYLINVNGTYPVTGNGKGNPERIINHGFADYGQIMNFEEPDMILNEMKHEIGNHAIYPDITFLCYPNTAEEDGPGTPFTRLVIEGTLEGRTCYWPISINRPPHGNGGIEGNCRYTYDIIIRSRGTDNPDRPAESRSVSAKMETARWKEKEEYTIGF